MLVSRLLVVALLVMFFHSGTALAQTKSDDGSMRVAHSVPVLAWSAGADTTGFDPAGMWQGALAIGGAELRLVFHVERGADGAWAATMDSPDQGATGIPTSATAVRGDTLRVEVAGIGGVYEGVADAEGASIDGTWQQGGQSFPLVLRRTDEAATVPERPQMPEAPYPYATEEVRFENADDGITLAGTLSLPEGEGPHPAVVLITGSGPQDRDETLFGHKPFLVLADYLARHGVATLRYDERGVGASTGSFAGATSADLARDVEAAVRYLEARREVGPIGLVGHSEGGLVAPRVAREGDAVRAVVLLAGPAVRGDRLLARQNVALLAAAGVSEEGAEAYGQRLEAVLGAVVGVPLDRPLSAEEQAALRDTLEAGLTAMAPADRKALGVPDASAVVRQAEAAVRSFGQPWMRYFLQYDPGPALHALEVPVLALFGSKDLQVLPAQNVAPMREALAGTPAATVEVVDGVNHLFQPAPTGAPAEYAQIETTIAPVVLDRVTAWLQQQLAPTGSSR